MRPLVPRLTLRRPKIRALVAVADRPTAQAVVDLKGSRSPRAQRWLVVGSTVLFVLVAFIARRWTTWVYLAALLVLGPYALVAQRRLLANGTRQGLVPQGRGGRGVRG